jgi:TolB-like protein/Flp pilus assembly protein TadD
VLLIGAGVFFFLRQQPKAPETKAVAPAAKPTGKTAIAVLPFTNLSADKDQEYFSDGLTEELLNVLAKNPKLQVTSRTSAFSFKGTKTDIKTIAEKLNVTHVLEGSVRKGGNQLRITAQLIEVATDSHLWSQTYDRQMENIFAVQDDISASVAGALKVALDGDKTPKVQQTNPEAYNAYLQGQYFYDRRTKEDLEKATGYYEQALKIDPGFARAWVGLARTQTAQADRLYLPSDDAYVQARQKVQKALELDPNLSEAYTQMGWIRMIYDWDWTGAEEAYRRALELDPANADAIRGTAALASVLGRFDEAIELDRRAVALDPLRLATHYNLGLHYYYSGRLSESQVAFRKALELNPQFQGAHYLLGYTYLLQNQLEEALSEIKMESEPVYLEQGMALAHHALGNKKEADASLANLIENYQNEMAFQIAEIYAYRGETDKAFEWLERAYKQRDAGLTEMKGNPLLRNIEKDPRYTAFLKKMNLPVD